MTHFYRQIGHSMGGATTVLSLANDARFIGGIALDAWLFPLRDEIDLNTKIGAKPLMFLSTDSFRSEGNVGKIKEFIHDQPSSRHFYFIKGSVHQNHLDVPFILKARFRPLHL